MTYSPTAHTRRFGVEIEFGLGEPGGYQCTSASTLRKAQALFTEAKGFSKGWRIGADGSGVEARTPILQGEKGLSELERAYTAIIDAGGYVTIADGLHVHHDAPEFVARPELCKTLAKVWCSNRKAIYSMVAPWRHNADICIPMTPDLKGERPSTDGWFDITFAKLSKWGTVEIRLHEGTLDYSAVRAWILFTQKLIWNAVSRRTPVAGQTEREALLKLIGVSSGVQETMARKAALRHVPPQMRGDWEGLIANGWRADHENGPKKRA